MPSKLISFSRNFKIQYFQRDKNVRGDIDQVIKNVENILKFMIKNKIPFSKIKMRVDIKSSCEYLLLIITPTPKIILKRLE